MIVGVAFVASAVLGVRFAVPYSGSGQVLGQEVPPMRYPVYTDLPTRTSTVHKETCRYYVNRKSDRLPDNWWHGPYSSDQQAESQGWSKGVSRVRRCSVCMP